MKQTSESFWKFRLGVECSDAVMVRMFLSLLDHPADCSSQEPLILRISDDFILDDFMHLLNDDKITNYGHMNK